jgi:signal transduction histidine kinase
MKRSWISILAVCGFVGLLVVLGVLQYRWLSQVSEAEIERQQRRLNSDTEKFAADFNREVQAAYFNFQRGAETWKKKDWAEFNDRYAFWQSKTAFPTLIKNVIFVENKADAEPLVYDPAKRAFVPGEVPTEFEPLRARFTVDDSFQPVYDDVPALVTPIHESMEEPMRRVIIRERSPGGATPDIPMPLKYGYLVVILDSATLRDKVLPELVQKYFPEGDYAVSVSDREKQPIFHTQNGTTGADASAKLFDVSPENLMFYTNTDMMSQLNQRQNVFVRRNIDSQTIRSEIHGDGKGGLVKIEVNRGEAPKTAVLERTDPTAAGYWQMQVQHRDGSIADHAAGVRRQSLAVGFGLLTLLGTGVLLIFISAQRARSLAQRQIDFVSSVSHEFRTPLAVIYSAGENLADGVTSDPVQTSKYGELIKGEGRKLSSMVEQILEFAGANSGRSRFNIRPMSASQILSDAVQECRPLIDDQKVDLETEIDSDLPLIDADGEALSRAIQNLIVNSIKYRNGSGWIRVSARNGGGTVKISVEDKGIGIAKYDLPKIFEPFYRSKEVVNAQIHGNGLGLSLVKQIMDAHKGRITAESELGKGSVFAMEIPASRS